MSDTANPIEGIAAVAIDCAQPETLALFDLHSADFEAAIQHALAGGATLADDVHSEDPWRVLRDPEGNEFCISPPRRPEAAVIRRPGS